MAKDAYSMEIVEAIRSFLEGDDWNFDFNDEIGLFKFNLSIKAKIKEINYFIRVHADDFVLNAVSPIGADADDKDMMANMAEFICRANYGLRNGNFDFDMNDGEIRYKTYVDCDGGLIPTEEVIRNTIYCTAAMFERYAKGITDVIFAGTPAEDAIRKCED